MTLAFTLSGQRGDSCETVVLSAGLGGAAAFWGPQMEALEVRYRVLAYDHRGTGANAGPLPDPYTVAHMAADVVALLDGIGVERAHLIGHALGGLVGLQLGLQAPGRLRSLVLVNSWARLDPHTARCFAARLALLRHVGPEAYVRAQPIFLYPAAWLSANVERMARDDAHALDHFQGAPALEARVAALQAFDVASRLGTIKVPTLLAASRDDVLVPYTCSQVLADGLPNATMAVVPEGGHAFTVTAAAGFNQTVLSFLAGVATPS